MPTSEAVSRGVRVRVESRYFAGRSRPERSEWFFLYHVRITNEGREGVQLIGRHIVALNAHAHPQFMNPQPDNRESPGIAGRRTDDGGKNICTDKPCD